MDAKKWAEQEVELACKKENPDRKEGEWDYGCACYESALKAFKCLCEDHHSGMSMAITRNILDRLIDMKPLTPIEDTEDVWKCIHTDSNVTSYQCKRYLNLLKYVYTDGTVKYYDNSLCRVIDVDEPDAYYHNSFIINEIIKKMFPITMPYMPESRPARLYCKSFLVDKKNGDYDTLAILYIRKQDGTRVEINRFFDCADDFREISREEYEERKKNAI